MLYNMRMEYIYPNRYKICGACEYLLGDVCQKIDLHLGDFINLRLATCPKYKWG
jgi:hypothetical protein